MAVLSEISDPRLVSSVEDLVDPGARALVQAYRIKITELLPNFFELVEILDGGISINHDNPWTPLNIHTNYMNLFASGLAVCYEVIRRGEVSFPIGLYHFCTFDGISFSSFSTKCYLTLDNDNSIDYPFLALLYTVMLEKLEKQRLSFLEKRLGIDELL